MIITETFKKDGKRIIMKTVCKILCDRKENNV